MRVDVKKYLFIGVKPVLDAFFAETQDIGLVHFIDKRNQKGKEVPADIQRVTHAIKVLRELPVLNQEEPAGGFAEADSITDKILQLKEAIDKLEEEVRITRLEIARIEAFGQFSLDDIAFLEKEGNRKVQFFFAKQGKPVPEELIPIASEHGLDYFISINKTPVQYENMVEMHVEEELRVLKKQLGERHREIHEIEQKLKRYQKYNTFLHHALVRKYNDVNQEVARSYASTEMENTLFAVEGWVPQNKVEQLKTSLKDIDVHVSEISIEPEEVVPTYLENKGVSRVGEDLVYIYDTPANTDRDPSLWVLFSFALFFAVIIGDGGYGLAFLVGALYFRYKNPTLRAGGRRVWTLVLMLSTACILWGLCTQSFFGIKMNPDNPIVRASVLNVLIQKKAAHHMKLKDEVYREWTKKFPLLRGATTPDAFLQGAVKKSDGKQSYEMYERFGDGILMEIALLIGVIHICLSLLRYLDRHWAGIGWVIAIIGCYLNFPQFLHATSMLHYLFGFPRDELAQGGEYLIYGGVSLAVVLAIIKDKIFGCIEITQVIQIFADILSYLRLYALALAGSIISGTVNDIAGSVNFVVAGILLVAGHSLNMVLSVIGGIIHGLRLNFIEWYHYSFDGGGKQYNPLRKMEY